MSCQPHRVTSEWITHFKIEWITYFKIEWITYFKTEWITHFKTEWITHFKILLHQLKTQVTKSQAGLIQKINKYIYQYIITPVMVCQKPISPPLLGTHLYSVGTHHRNLLKWLVTMRGWPILFPGPTHQTETVLAEHIIKNVQKTTVSVMLLLSQTSVSIYHTTGTTKPQY